MQPSINSCKTVHPAENLNMHDECLPAHHNNNFFENEHLRNKLKNYASTILVQTITVSTVELKNNIMQLGNE